MAFSVRLAPEGVAVDPGSSVPVAVEVLNEGSSADEYELSVEGLDQEWVAIPVPSFWVEPGATHVERFFLKPERGSESKAGTYPFVVRVRSLETSESRIVQGSLEINSFTHLTVETDPRRVVLTGLRKDSEVVVQLSNLGNMEQSLQLFATDVDNVLTFDFEAEQVSLAPGQQRAVGLTVSTSRAPFLGGTAMEPVTVSVRDVSNPAVSASSQLHVEVRPTVAPGPLLAVLALMVLVVGWVLSIPKPPEVQALSLSAKEVMLGEPVTVQWTALHATSVTLTYGGQTLEKLPVSSQLRLTPESAGTLEVTVVAVAGERRSAGQTVVVVVTEPPVVPAPEIKSFTAERSTVPIGSPVTLRFELGPSVTYAYLEPIGEVEPRSRSMQVPSPPDDIVGAGSKSVTYTLLARNANRQEVRRTVTVRFVKESRARILRFEADPLEVDPLTGRVTLSWQVSEAVRLVLRYGEREDELQTANDRRDFVVDADTTFTLVATDAQGLSVERTVSVKVKPPVQVVPPAGSGDGAGTTGDGAGGIGTTGGGSGVGGGATGGGRTDAGGNGRPISYTEPPVGGRSR